MRVRVHRWPGECSQRCWIAFGAVAWWVMILVSLPFGRMAVDALRQRGLLTVAVLAGLAGVFLVFVAVGLRLSRQGRLSRRQWLAALTMTSGVVLAVLWIPRVEERWHVVEYGIMGALCWAAGHDPLLRRVAGAAAVVAVAGWIDEGVQHVLPSRVFDWWDVGLNAVSGLTGAGIAGLSQWWAFRKRDAGQDGS